MYFDWFKGMSIVIFLKYTGKLKTKAHESILCFSGKPSVEKLCAYNNFLRKTRVNEAGIWNGLQGYVLNFQNLLNK